jgi:hypothetical protein
MTKKDSIKLCQLCPKGLKRFSTFSMVGIALLLSGAEWDVTMANTNTGAVTVSSTETLTDQTITASDTDESGILVTSGGSLSITNSTITTTGNTSNSDSSSFFGKNAGILVTTKGAITKLDSCKITTSGKGANGVFAYGSGTIVMSNDTINCTGGYAHGIMCSGGGTITVTNCYAKTTLNNGSVIATDKGSGTITISGGYYEADGQDAAGIYSTGKITASDASFKSGTNTGCIIEGSNSIVLTNCTVTAKTKGIKLFQSGSGDADGVLGVFTMTNGTLTTSAGPLIYGTNANGTATLTNVSTTNSSDTLIWVDSASKGGGKVHLIAKNQVLKGTANSDAYSSFSIKLQDTSSWTGSANTLKKSKSVSITLDSTSTWTLTANSYVDTMVDAAISGTKVSNITGNNYNIYYNSSASPSLGGKTYTLTGGGCLLPQDSTCSSTGIIETGSIRSLYSSPLVSMLTVTGSVSFSPVYSENIKTVGLYDLAGKQISVRKFKKNQINVHNDFGVSEGAYIVKIIGIK